MERNMKSAHRVQILGHSHILLSVVLRQARSVVAGIYDEEMRQNGPISRTSNVRSQYL